MEGDVTLHEGQVREEVAGLERLRVEGEHRTVRAGAATRQRVAHAPFERGGARDAQPHALRRRGAGLHQGRRRVRLPGFHDADELLELPRRERNREGAGPAARWRQRRVSERATRGCRSGRSGASDTRPIVDRRGLGLGRRRRDVRRRVARDHLVVGVVGIGLALEDVPGVGARQELGSQRRHLVWRDELGVATRHRGGALHHEDAAVGADPGDRFGARRGRGERAAADERREQREAERGRAA